MEKYWFRFINRLYCSINIISTINYSSKTTKNKSKKQNWKHFFQKKRKKVFVCVSLQQTKHTQKNNNLILFQTVFKQIWIGVLSDKKTNSEENFFFRFSIFLSKNFEWKKFYTKMLRLREAMKKEQAARTTSPPPQNSASNGGSNTTNHASIAEIRLQKGF